MDRRKFLNQMTTATLGLCVAVSAAKAGVAFNPTVMGPARTAAPLARAGVCRVIGVGSRGCDTVLALSRSPAGPGHLAMQSEFICVNGGHDSLDYIDASNAALGAHQPPIKTLSLCSDYLGSSVAHARTVAWQKRTELCALMHDADLVFLVAGLGGGLESGVPPLMAAWAREAHAFVVAAATMPFEWEGEQRMARAKAAFRHLQHAADLAVPFSNEKLVQTLGEAIQADAFFAAQDQQILTCLHSVVAKDGYRPPPRPSQTTAVSPVTTSPRKV